MDPTIRQNLELIIYMINDPTLSIERLLNSIQSLCLAMLVQPIEKSAAADYDI
jgi:hypothetical protein